MSTSRHYRTRRLAGRTMTAIGVVAFGLAGCQSSAGSRAGLMQSPDRVPGGGVQSVAESGAPDWLRWRKPSGTLLSADETYLRDHARDLAAPDNDKIGILHRSLYMTETVTRIGSGVAPEQDYYLAQNYKRPASEEARVNVLLADLHRANARLDAYLGIAERVLDLEEKRIEAIHNADLRLTSQRDLEKLLEHSIGNRHAIAFAMQGLPARISSYAYAAKRARIDLPGSSDHFNIDAQVARLSHAHSRMSARIGVLDQQISDVLTLPTHEG